MIKQVLKYSIYTFLLIGAVVANAQERQLKKANEKFENYSFIDAREAYIEVYEKGFQSADLFQKLGDSYYFNGDYVNAEKWYEELYKLEGASTKPEYMYRYGLTLKSLKNYEKSDQIMMEFSKTKQEDERAEIFINERNYLKEIEKNSGRFTLKNEDFNSDLSDYAPSFYGEELVISTNRDRGTATHRIHTWNNQPFSDLFVVHVGKDSGEKAIDNFDNTINSKFHESSSVFTKDGKTVYFTRNNYTDKKLKSDNEGINRLKLYKGVKSEDDKWTVTELPFNGDNYSVAHPALSVDENILYFASDMEGGMGASDLYMVTIDGDSYGTPVNLGEGINTEARETFPFVSADNRLYFASDGHPGLGGLDVFVAEIYSENDFSESYNVGAPVNGIADDFTFIINADTKKGYFASNRAEGKGDDDIYSFVENRSLVFPFEQTIEGEVLNETTEEPVEGVTVSLIDDEGNVVTTVTTDDEGKYTLPIEERSTQYAIRYEKDNFETKEKPFASTNENGRVFKDVETIKLGNNLGVTQVGLGDDLNNALGLNPIYFDFDKSNIRPDAEIELQKVIAVMEKYPNLKIDVRSHTDSRANDAYNDALSKRRNKSTLNYIISKGIDKNRLTGDGYGESKLVNECSNGVECTEQQHQLNRRSEFIIAQQ